MFASEHQCRIYLKIKIWVTEISLSLNCTRNHTKKFKNWTRATCRQKRRHHDGRERWAPGMKLEVIGIVSHRKLSLKTSLMMGRRGARGSGNFVVRSPAITPNAIFVDASRPHTSRDSMAAWIHQSQNFPTKINMERIIGLFPVGILSDDAVMPFTHTCFKVTPSCLKTINRNERIAPRSDKNTGYTWAQGKRLVSLLCTMVFLPWKTRRVGCLGWMKRVWAVSGTDFFGLAGGDGENSSSNDRHPFPHFPRIFHTQEVSIISRWRLPGALYWLVPLAL
jgi:hypothetical protein